MSTSLRKNRIFISISFLAFLVFPAFSASAASVNIAPASASATIGSQFTLSINLDSVSDLFGAAFDLIYDPAVIQFVSAEKGTFLEQGSATTYLSSDATNPPGDLQIGYSRVTGGANGSGTLMTLTFRGLASGLSGLNFQYNALCNSDPGPCVGSTVIPATWSNGTATITNADTTPPAAPHGLSVL